MIDILEIHDRNQTSIFEHTGSEVLESLLVVHVPRHFAAFKVLIDPVILEVHVGTDVSLATLHDEVVKIEFQDLLVDSKCVL